MLKCFVFVLCAVSLITIVFCASGYDNIREKQSTQQDVTQFRTDATSRTRRQTLGNLDLVYIDAASIDFTKLKDLQSKETSRLAPVNDVTNPGQTFQVPSDTNLELVTQNSNYIVYKLKSTGDSLPNGLPDVKRAQTSSNQYYTYDSEQYSGYSDVRNLPPPPPPDDRKPPPPPDDREPPPPPPPGYREPPPPPPPDHHHPPPPHHYPPPPPPHHYPPPPPPPHHYPPPPHHHHPPPPPDDYRSSYYDRYSHYDRPPPPRSSYEDRSRRFYDDRQTRQSPYDRPPPPHRDGPQYGRPPPRHGGPPPPRDGGGPPRYEEPPRHHHGPPPDYGGPPRYHGGPPDRYDRRPPPPPDRFNDRRPPPRDGPPHHFDDRPPHDRRPPPPPDDRRPPPHREQTFDQGNGNNEYSQNDDNSAKLIDVTQTSSTTETGTYDSRYQLDIRFSEDEQRAAEAMKRNVNLTTARPLSPFIFQAAAVTPED